jgi:tripartite-type tricarboxylate transporter receptor subunit TctC
MPAVVRDTLNAELNRYLALPETRQRLAASAFAPAGGPPQSVTDLIAGDTARWAEVVRFANIEQRS